MLCLQAASTSSQRQSHGTTGVSDLSSWCAWKRAMLPRAGWCPEPLAEHQPAAWAWPCSIRCLGSPASTSLELQAQLCLVQRGVGRGDPTRKRSPVNQRRARGHLVRCCLAQPRGRVALSSHLGFAQWGQTWLALGVLAAGISISFPWPFCSFTPSGPPRRCDLPSCRQLTKPKSG